ncbi:MAG: putative signal transducing protein [Thermoanaerobaculia bacterium]
MICPECDSEYREGFTRCSGCDVDLIEPVPGEPDIELTRVYMGSNPAIVPLIESLLADAGIEFMKKFDGVQDFFAAGRLLGLNQIVGPVEFWVREDDAEQALELLAEIDESGPAGFLLPSAP